MGFKTDIEIAQETADVSDYGDCCQRQVLMTKYLEQYGKYKAKIDYNLLKRDR